jgi:4-hydroxythreonine-4-phosphate dehydrogenase
VLLVGPESALLHHARRRGTKPFWTRVADAEEAGRSGAGIALLEPEGLGQYEPAPGRGRPEGGRAAGLSLDAACSLLQRGAARALVTLPLNKAMLQAGGYDFAGHTEFLAARAGLSEADVCMHLCGHVLRVSLATTHPPLRAVPDLITRERVLRCLTLTWRLVGALGVAGQGPIAVCGLNPHAGEEGRIGHEEVEVIGPAVAEAVRAGVDAVGPLPADTVFHRAGRGEFCAVLAMYHDQGLGPLKLMHFGRAVNVTLGLPWVRTSVDHGTGYDLAGKDQADTSSLAAALSLAITLCENQG